MVYAAIGGGSADGRRAGSATDADTRVYSLYKIGLVSDVRQTYLKIEEALAIVARVYAVRCGVNVNGAAGVSVNEATSAGDLPADFAPGLSGVPEPVRSYAQFAIDNGLASYVVKGAAFPAGRDATRGEVAAFVYAALELLGDI
jgi:hypothetical protein